MRIGINATCIGQRPSGARQRLLGLLPELAKLMPESEFVVFEPADARIVEQLDPMPNMSARSTPLSSADRWQRLVVGKRYWKHALAREHFDVFEALHMPVVRAPTGKTVLTIHDLRGLAPGSTWVQRRVFRHLLRRSIARADHVVTVSEAMRAEILAFSSATPVSVVCNGLDASLFPDTSTPSLRQDPAGLQFPGRYALAVGHFEPRKNYPTLIDAIDVLGRRGMPVPLVIVGNDSGEHSHIEVLVSDRGLQDSVLLLSGLEDDLLRHIYRDAELFVFPSTYEGFGIPLLEAMASGIPIAASDIPVFHEVLGDAGVFFDPVSAESMASAIGSLRASATLRERLVSNGARRVKDFDFSKLALDMAAVYRSCAA